MYEHKTSIDALTEIFGGEFTSLPAAARAAVQADMIDLANAEYRTYLGATRVLRDRIRPATLASYAATLLAGVK
jgi:hypothetical protein